MSETKTVYASTGEPIAFVAEDAVFSIDGKWAGVIAADQSIFDQTGKYIGFLMSDGRVALDTSAPLRTEINAPQPRASRPAPQIIIRRKPLPPLPPPFIEPTLISRDSSGRALTFGIASLAATAVGVGIVAFLFKTLSQDTPLGNESLLALLWAPSTIAVITGAVAAFAAVALSSPQLRRAPRILLVGRSQEGASAVSDLQSKLGRRARVVAWAESYAEYVSSAGTRLPVDIIVSLKKQDHASSNGSDQSGYLHTDAALSPQEAIERFGERISLPSKYAADYFATYAHASFKSADTIKRAFDIALSICLIFFSAPILVVTAILIKLESSGPILYTQQRVGQNGQIFHVLRFRSMRIDTEKDSRPVWASAADSRVTRVGSVIRRLRIDELPQLFTVLLGPMSMVGPRPERPFFVDQLTREIPLYEKRFLVKPGVTGLAQVRYEYGATIEDSHEKLEFDLYYVKHRSLLLDLKVLLETIGVVLSGSRSF